MQHTTKMVMVPHDAYSSLMAQQKQLYSPVVNQLANMDQDLQSIISNPGLSSDAKYHQYMQVFGRFQQLKNQQFQHPPSTPATRVVSTDVQTTDDIPIIHLPIEERRLIETLPKPVRRKGKLLLDHLKDHHKSFQWLQSGELVVDGKPIKGSNITDLVHHITRNRPTAAPPKGIEEFSEILENTNVPKEALSTSDLFKTPTTSFGTSFSPVEASTPRSQQTIRKRQPKKKLVPRSSPKARPTRDRKEPDRYVSWTAY